MKRTNHNSAAQKSLFAEPEDEDEASYYDDENDS